MNVEPPPFSPVLGDVGSWTLLPDGSVGQVWSLAPKVSAKKWSRVAPPRTMLATVWVANGREFQQVPTDELRELSDLDDVPMFDMEEPA